MCRERLIAEVSLSSLHPLSEDHNGDFFRSLVPKRKGEQRARHVEARTHELFLPAVVSDLDGGATRPFDDRTMDSQMLEEYRVEEYRVEEQEGGIDVLSSKIIDDTVRLVGTARALLVGIVDCGGYERSDGTATLAGYHRSQQQSTGRMVIGANLLLNGVSKPFGEEFGCWDSLCLRIGQPGGTRGWSAPSKSRHQAAIDVGFKGVGVCC